MRSPTSLEGDRQTRCPFIGQTTHLTSDRSHYVRTILCLGRLTVSLRVPSSQPKFTPYAKRTVRTFQTDGTFLSGTQLGLNRARMGQLTAKTRHGICVNETPE